jgi:hypothetical protein
MWKVDERLMDIGLFCWEVLEKPRAHDPRRIDRYYRNFVLFPETRSKPLRSYFTVLKKMMSYLRAPGRTGRPRSTRLANKLLIYVSKRYPNRVQEFQTS